MTAPHPLRIAILQGPNLNLLGTREPEVYGHDTLDHIHARLHALAAELGVTLTTFQSNHEGALIDRLHEIRPDHHAVIINPGGLTHTSIALRDALAAVALPLYEVHLSNIHAREPFRHNSFVSPIATAVLCGLGAYGYEAALHAAVARLRG